MSHFCWLPTLVISVLGFISGVIVGGLLSGTEGLENDFSWADVAEVVGKAWFSTLPYVALWRWPPAPLPQV